MESRNLRSVRPPRTHVDGGRDIQSVAINQLCVRIRKWLGPRTNSWSTPHITRTGAVLDLSQQTYCGYLPSRLLAGTKLYFLVTEVHVCKQLVQDCTRQRNVHDTLHFVTTFCHYV